VTTQGWLSICQSPNDREKHGDEEAKKEKARSEKKGTILQAKTPS